MVSTTECHPGHEKNPDWLAPEYPGSIHHLGKGAGRKLGLHSRNKYNAGGGERQTAGHCLLKRAPANVAAAKTTRPVDSVNGRIGTFLRFTHRGSTCGDV